MSFGVFFFNNNNDDDDDDYYYTYFGVQNQRQILPLWLEALQQTAPSSAGHAA